MYLCSKPGKITTKSTRTRVHEELVERGLTLGELGAKKRKTSDQRLVQDSVLEVPSGRPSNRGQISVSSGASAPVVEEVTSNSIAVQVVDGVDGDETAPLDPLQSQAAMLHALDGCYSPAANSARMHILQAVTFHHWHPDATASLRASNTRPTPVIVLAHQLRIDRSSLRRRIVRFKEMYQGGESWYRYVRKKQKNRVALEFVRQWWHDNTRVIPDQRNVKRVTVDGRKEEHAGHLQEHTLTDMYEAFSSRYALLLRLVLCFV